MKVRLESTCPYCGHENIKFVEKHDDLNGFATIVECVTKNKGCRQMYAAKMTVSTSVSASKLHYQEPHVKLEEY